MSEEKRPPRRVTMDDQVPVTIRAALVVALERAGGTMEYTEAEYQAVRARHGEYLIKTKVDTSGPVPVVRLWLEPSNEKGSMPVS